jgi:hypothetical protein
VTAGRSYTLGAWYESSGPVVFNAYYRTPEGAWKFWVTSPPMPASRGWTPGKWTAPAVPSGATAVSFGLALRSDGTLATTRYSLAPVRYTSTRLIAFTVVIAIVLVAAVTTRRLRRRRGLPGSGPRCGAALGPRRPVTAGTRYQLAVRAWAAPWSPWAAPRSPSAMRDSRVSACSSGPPGSAKKTNSVWPSAPIFEPQLLRLPGQATRYAGRPADWFTLRGGCGNGTR